MSKKKRFVALARVSSREQEREGFSLDVQEDALRQYADRVDGEIVRFFRIAETASKKDERKSFQELLSYAKKNAKRLDGLLFYVAVGRAPRVYPWVNEPDGGILCEWNISNQVTQYTI